MTFYAGSEEWPNPYPDNPLEERIVAHVDRQCYTDKGNIRPVSPCAGGRCSGAAHLTSPLPLVRPFEVYVTPAEVRSQGVAGHTGDLDYRANAPHVAALQREVRAIRAVTDAEAFGQRL